MILTFSPLSEFILTGAIFNFGDLLDCSFSSRGYSNALSSVPLYESRSNLSISDSRYSTFPHIM